MRSINLFFPVLSEIITYVHQTKQSEPGVIYVVSGCPGGKTVESHKMKLQCLWLDSSHGLSVWLLLH